MKNKRRLIFRIAALAIVLVIAAVMFVIGRGHTMYFDNKEIEYNGQTIGSYYKVNVELNGKEVAKLSSGDRGMGEIMGQSLKMTVIITDEKDAKPHAHKISMSVPYSMDGITINIPALMAGLPEDAYLSEFEILAPAEDEEGTDDANPDDMGTEEFEMGDI